MIHSRLALKLFAVVIPFIIVFSLAIYGLSVPFIKKTVYELEEQAGRSVLDTVFELTNRIHLNLENHRELEIESHKSRLKSVIELTASYISLANKNVKTGVLSREKARAELYAKLSQVRYNNNDYIWVSDYDGVLVSHPDANAQGSSGVQEKDENGRFVLPVMVDIARNNGDGYYQYLWRRLGGEQAISKISYFRDFPEWNFVIGTGVYLDDIEAGIQRRKTQAITDLRKVLRDIPVGRTGYLYIFDSNYKMVIHPNANIEGTYFGELVDPISKKPIGSELTAVADSQVGRHYKWDRPEDPNNYAYDKISWVRHFPGFDWYIASSVYVSELQEGSRVMGNRILIISLSVLILSGFLSFMFIRRITGPIKQLAATAERVQKGDLSARSNIHREDEIGVLSSAFDGMVVRLQHNIDNLDATVQDRTVELEQSNIKLTETVLQLKSVQQELAKSEMRQRVILDEIPAFVAQLDSQHRIEFVNRRYADLFGAKKADLLGVSMPEKAGWLDHPHIMQVLRGEKSISNEPYTTTWKGSDGSSRVLKTMLIPTVGSQSSATIFFVLTLDVTDEEKSRKHLMDMQRMNAVAHLAAGLAHDLNNLLSIILGNLSSASDRYTEEPVIQGYLQPAMRATRRSADIMGRLLAFSRSQPLQPIAVDVGRLLHSAAVLLRRSLPENVSLIISVEEGEYWVYADLRQLENAVVNLVLNAKDAMPAGGAIDISASKFEQSAARQSGLIQLHISDEGQGFTEEALERAFEPFYSTKKAGAGSGLGLSMVFGFAAQSGGDVAIESQQNKGTIMTLSLPIAESHRVDELRNHQTVEANEQQWDGKVVVLVEDEPELRDTVRRQLLDLGFSVLVCVNGDEALELIQHVDELYLLVSDIVMPGNLSGVSLSEQVTSIKPDVAILLMTGYVTQDVVVSENNMNTVILQKPFDLHDLRDAIHRSITAVHSMDK